MLDGYIYNMYIYNTSYIYKYYQITTTPICVEMFPFTRWVSNASKNMSNIRRFTARPVAVGQWIFNPNEPGSLASTFGTVGPKLKKLAKRLGKGGMAFEGSLVL